MATNQVNMYSVSSASSNSSAAAASSASSLDMNDFMQLLAAQFTNQDVMNPSDSTEYVSQMAQFTSLQAMQELSQITYAQYGASLVGKKVVVASYDQNGKYKEETGVVDSVNFASGSNVLVVNGNAYDLSAVMEIVNPAAATTPDDTSGTSDETTPDDKSNASDSIGDQV